MSNEATYYDGPWSNNVSAVHGTQISFGGSKLTVGNLSLRDNGDEYIYTPKEDITPYEVSLLLRLFTVAGTSGNWYGISYDYWGFVTEHNLQRHFKFVKKEN
jgi:hypothetical protein